MDIVYGSGRTGLTFYRDVKCGRIIEAVCFSQ